VHFRWSSTGTGRVRDLGGRDWRALRGVTAYFAGARRGSGLLLTPSWGDSGLGRSGAACSLSLSLVPSRRALLAGGVMRAHAGPAGGKCSFRPGPGRTLALLLDGRRPRTPRGELLKGGRRARRPLLHQGAARVWYGLPTPSVAASRSRLPRHDLDASFRGPPSIEWDVDSSNTNRRRENFKGLLPGPPFRSRRGLDHLFL